MSQVDFDNTIVWQEIAIFARVLVHNVIVRKLTVLRRDQSGTFHYTFIPNTVTLTLEKQLAALVLCYYIDGSYTKLQKFVPFKSAFRKKEKKTEGPFF